MHQIISLMLALVSQQKQVYQTESSTPNSQQELVHLCLLLALPLQWITWLLQVEAVVVKVMVLVVEQVDYLLTLLLI
jgi:hypothetical protein